MQGLSVRIGVAPLGGLLPKSRSICEKSSTVLLGKQILDEETKQTAFPEQIIRKPRDANALQFTCTFDRRIHQIVQFCDGIIGTKPVTGSKTVPDTFYSLFAKMCLARCPRPSKTQGVPPGVVHSTPSPFGRGLG